MAFCTQRFGAQRPKTTIKELAPNRVEVLSVSGKRTEYWAPKAGGQVQDVTNSPNSFGVPVYRDLFVWGAMTNALGAGLLRDWDNDNKDGLDPPLPPLLVWSGKGKLVDLIRARNRQLRRWHRQQELSWENNTH